MLFLYDYFCILWNIHLTHARNCSCRHSLSWVVFMPSSGVGLVVSVPIIGAGTREIWKFWEGLGRWLGKFGALLVVCIDCLDVVTCGVTRWLGRGCRAAWLGVGCSGQPVGQGAHVDVVVALGLCGRLSAAFFHVLETARTLGHASWWAQDVGVYVHFVGGVSSVFRGSCLFDLWASWL